MTHIPEAIGSLINLQQLDLDKSVPVLTEIPEGIGSMINLQQLVLGKCSGLTKIPEAMGLIEQPQAAGLELLFQVHKNSQGHWVNDNTLAAERELLFECDPEFRGNDITYSDVHAIIASCKLWSVIHLHVLDLYNGSCVTHTSEHWVIKKNTTNRAFKPDRHLHIM